MADFIQTDDYQWLREIDGGYEMYQVLPVADLETCPYFAGGGTFSISDYDDEDAAHALRVFGYESMDEVERIYGDHAERTLAECLFECNFADWDLVSFGTFDAALDYINKLMAD